VLDLPLPIVIGSDGLPLITYNIESRPEDLLMVGHCDGIACSSATWGRLLPLGITTRAKGSAVVIGADGLPVIAYKGSGPRLTIAHCDNIECTQMSSVEVEPTNSAAYFISMTIGTDGLPIASYWARTEIDLKVAHCSDATCSEATITTLDAEGSVGADTSIVINPGGLLIISYYDDTSKNLKVGHCDDAAYSTFTISIVNDDFPEAGPTSIAIGSDGLPVITSPSKVAHCKDVKCSTD